MVLLRIAIGWHLCYEGMGKIQSHRTEVKPFSAEMYLRNSAGPLSPYFREMVGDFHGLAKLDYDSVLASWKAHVDRIATDYKFAADQRTRADALFNAEAEKLKEYLNGETTKVEIAQYREKVAEWEEAGRRPMPAFELAGHKKVQGELFAEKQKLTTPVVAQTKQLDSEIRALFSPEQGLMTPPIDWKGMPDLERINLTTMWGLTIFGGCLMVGLFTRTAALGSAVLLLMFYFAMPPWPGLPPNPMAEGSYLIVNKNLIEAIACLMLATTSSGVWGGLDALIRGLITRPIFGVGKGEIRDWGDDF